MTEVLASRSFRGPAAEDAIEAVHNDLDSLWLDVPFVNDMDQMTFTTAVIESASNIVQHAEPAGDRAVDLSPSDTTVSLKDLRPEPDGTSAVVRRIGEPIQTDSRLMHALRSAGVGARLVDGLTGEVVETG